MQNDLITHLDRIAGQLSGLAREVDRLKIAQETPPGYVSQAETAEQKLLRKMRILAEQRLKAPAIAIQLATNLNTVYTVAREHGILLNRSRNHVTQDIVNDALHLLEDGDGVSVIGAAVEVDISPASLQRIINGDHPVMNHEQKRRVANLVNLDYTLIR